MLETPLTSWHKENGAKMAEFAGYDMPIQYAGILAEHEHTRKLASIFDICHMGEFIVSGKNAKESLSLAVTHNLENLAIGKCAYGFILNDNGGIIDDCIIYALEPESYMLVVNGACEQKDFDALNARLGEGITLENISAQTAKIDLQGPSSFDVLSKIIDYDLKTLGYFSFVNIEFNGVKLMVSRTGYTGELGYELYLPSDAAKMMWETLLKDENVKPAGLGARDTLRLEAGLPLYGQDLDEEHTPVESGYEAMLKSTANYVGKDKLSIINQKLIALTIEGRRSARHYDKVCLLDGTEIGMVTSGSYAPSLGHAIALAWVDKKYAEEGDLVVKTARTELPAKLAKMPFYVGTARKKLNS